MLCITPHTLHALFNLLRNSVKGCLLSHCTEEMRVHMLEIPTYNHWACISGIRTLAAFPHNLNSLLPLEGNYTKYKSAFNGVMILKNSQVERKLLVWVYWRITWHGKKNASTTFCTGQFLEPGLVTSFPQIPLNCGYVAHNRISYRELSLDINYIHLCNEKHILKTWIYS